MLTRIMSVWLILPSFDYTYVKLNGQLVAQLNPDGSKYFIHGDHLGSSTVVTNEAGDVVENTLYSPFGEVINGGSSLRFGYEGKEHDSVVGDTDFNFRKYNPSLGIFTQPDTLIPNVYDPQSLNKYMFENGNPYGNIDPSGHSIYGLFYYFKDLFTSVLWGNTGSLPNTEENFDNAYHDSPIEPVAKYSNAEDFGKIVRWGIDELSQSEGSWKFSDSHMSNVRMEGGESAVWMSVGFLSDGFGDDILRGANKALRESGTVTVKSFSEANYIRKNLFPDAQKIPGSGPLSKISNKKLFKENTFHNDFLIDINTGKVFNHEGLPFDHLDSNYPHINIKDKEGKKYTIIIDNTK